MMPMRLLSLIKLRNCETIDYFCYKNISRGDDVLYYEIYGQSKAIPFYTIKKSMPST